MPAKGQKSGYFVKCDNCGKIIYQTKTQYNKGKHHYCSNKCQHEYQHKLTYEDRECEICGKVFNVNKKLTQRFCSPKCQSEWQKLNVGHLNPKFEGETIRCEWCYKMFDAHKYNLEKYEHHFCSKSCRRAWYSNVFSQSQEWKEESKTRATRLLSDKKIETNTKPQRIINELLQDMNIQYRNEENFIYYSIDNYLQDYNLIIEVMGDFWHCNPLVYPNGAINEIQGKRILKDKAKRTYLRNNYQIEVLYLWESDIYNHLDVCRFLIAYYIFNKGKLENYNSFNYHVENNNLVLNNLIVYPYYEIESV